MKLKDIIEMLGLKLKSKADNLGREISRGYSSDLLSDVLANSRAGDLWVTLQIHQNIIAVASMKGLGGIILINGREPEEETIKKADIENIPVMVSDLPAFELIGKLYSLGITGKKSDA